MIIFVRYDTGNSLNKHCFDYKSFIFLKQYLPPTFYDYLQMKHMLSRTQKLTPMELRCQFVVLIVIAFPLYQHGRKLKIERTLSNKLLIVSSNLFVKALILSVRDVPPSLFSL